MEMTILIDNKKEGNLTPEWGFCVYIKNNDKSYLLDTGASNKYLENAKKLGISIKDIDYAILSHSHIDHSGGYKSFFEENKKAKLYLSKNATTECYCKFGPIKVNVGMPKYIMNDYKDRIEYVSGLYKLNEGVYILEHLSLKTKNAHLVRKIDGKFVFDNFSHEQDLIFDTPYGLVILNSCSHIGLDEILKEVKKTFPDKKIYMMVGGLHLADKSKKYDIEFANRLKNFEIEHIYTGHCTKERGFKILHKILGDKVVQVKCGMVIKA